MNLTESQAKAMLEIGGMIEEHDYILQRVLNDLLSCGYISWRTPDDPELTSIGKEVYDELAHAEEKHAT
jgi:hypothetical protein